MRYYPPSSSPGGCFCPCQSSRLLFSFLAITKLREGEFRGKAQLGDLSLPLAAGRPWFWHWRAGLGEVARLLLVARPHRVLVDDGTEQSCRGNQMGHVVWRRKILSGECSGPTVILLSGDIFFPFFFRRSQAERLTVCDDSHPLNYCNELFLFYLLSYLFLQHKHKCL